jgi:hypothetical protein
MRTPAVTLAAVAILAGCGGSKKTSSEPTTALLTAGHVDRTKVTFVFESAPQDVKASYVPRSQLAESGSGKPVPLKGTAYLMIHFTPAATAEATASTVTFSYKGRLESHVSQDGSSVTVSFE